MDFKQNYFEIFGLPVTFQVDINLLADRYLEMQKEVHPDNFSSSTDQEKRLSMQWATVVNTANETLRSPLRRAIYLLDLHGRKIAANPVLPPAFLMQQIELRERLEEIEEATNALEELDEFKADLQQSMKTVEQDFDKAFGVDNLAAEQAVYGLQFMNKLLVAANQLEEKLLDY